MTKYCDFHRDIEIDKESIDPAYLLRRIIKDQLNPLDLEIRIIFGESRVFQGLV